MGQQIYSFRFFDFVMVLSTQSYPKDKTINTLPLIVFVYLFIHVFFMLLIESY